MLTLFTGWISRTHSFELIFPKWIHRHLEYNSSVPPAITCASKSLWHYSYCHHLDFAKELERHISPEIKLWLPKVIPQEIILNLIGFQHVIDGMDPTIN